MGSSPRAGMGSSTRKPRRVRLLYERRVSLFSFLVALPGILVSAIFIWLQAWTVESKLGLLVLEMLAWWLLAMLLQEQATRPLQTLANVVAALREEDYSFRARGAATDDALGELSLEVNALADVLAEQRVQAIEATALLRRVVEEVEVPLFAFDPGQTLRLVNSAGERLLQQSAVRLLGRSADQIGLAACLTAKTESPVTLPRSNPATRWLVRRSTFRQRGVPHTLIVLADVSRALREEERTAWQRLIRVLGHELNNSLAPIKSIAGSLSARIANLKLETGERQDFERGLAVIENRAASLNRFLQAYRQLAQMPPPALRKAALRPIVERVVGLETRLPIEITLGPEIELIVDPDQIEQMLINLVRNAVEAAQEPPHNLQEEVVASPRCSEVCIGWSLGEREVIITVEDNGPGLLNPANVFVPFYTTKAQGSGIGLVLSRQIAEAHGGSIELTNRTDQQGCLAKIVLPRSSSTRTSNEDVGISPA